MHAAFVAVYLLALIGVGAYKARQVKTQADFSLAGRGLPVFVLVGTLLATWIGTGSIFGNAEETVNVGMPALLLPISGAVGILLLYGLAARIRRIGQFTLQDILEDRFGPAARVIGSLTLLAAYVIIVSYQYRAGAAVLERFIPQLAGPAGVIAVAAFVILYTALAGMYSVAYTDVANGILMTLGIAIALPILFMKAGGIGEVMAALPPAQRSPFGHYSAVALFGVLAPSLLLLLGDANMYQRFFSAKNPAAARKSAGWMLLGVVVLECMIILTALVGSALVNQGKTPPVKNPAHIIVSLSFDALPPVLGAVLVATIIAIVVSTADSYLLAPSTSMVRDIYQRFMDPHAPDRRVVRIGRGVVVVLGLLALGLAFTSDEFFRVALFAYTIYGVGVTPVVLAALFWKRATPAAAVSSMIAGVATAVIWKIWLTQGVVAGMDPILPAVCVSVLMLVGVTMTTRRRPT